MTPHPLLATGKLFTRTIVHQLVVVTDALDRLVAVGVIAKDRQTASVVVVGESEPLMTLRARWAGARPNVGEYIMSAYHPRCAYRIAERRVTGGGDDHVCLELRVQRVDLPLPDSAVVHPWRWSPHGKNAGTKRSVDIKLVPILCERHQEVLDALVRHGGWARPRDIGGSDRSHHRATLTRLVAKGLVEQQERTAGVVRGSYLYRATERGVAHARTRSGEVGSP